MADDDASGARTADGPDAWRIDAADVRRIEMSGPACCWVTVPESVEAAVALRIVPDPRGHGPGKCARIAEAEAPGEADVAPRIAVALGGYAPASCVNCPECGTCFEVLDGDTPVSERLAATGGAGARGAWFDVVGYMRYIADELYATGPRAEALREAADEIEGKEEYQRFRRAAGASGA